MPPSPKLQLQASVGGDERSVKFTGVDAHPERGTAEKLATGGVPTLTPLVITEESVQPPKVVMVSFIV